MAVHERSLAGYEGTLTPQPLRFLILPRYAFAGVFASKLFTAFFVACFAVPAGGLLWIYLHHNLAVLTTLRIQPGQLGAVDEWFFLGIMAVQSFSFGGLMALLIGPGLVSPDLSNGALALYLSRPFSRKEYVLGKMTVLAVLISAVTWIPGLLLFAFQSYLEGSDWFVRHLRIGGAIFAGAWMWIVTASLVALAASALMKRKVLAQALLLALPLAGAAVGNAINEMFGTTWGSALNLPEVMRALWQGLFGVNLESPLAPGVAVLVLGTVSLIALAVLARRLQPHEVVR